MLHTKVNGAFYVFNLQLFAGEGGGEGGAPAAETGSPAAEQTAVEGAPAVAQTEADVPVDLDAEFAELIKGKYKAQYQKSFESGLRNRMKGKDAKLAKLDTLAGIVADKYGLDNAKDVDALISKVEEIDREGLADRAFKNGVSEEQQRYIENLEAKNKRYERERAEREREEGIQRQVSEWARQAENLQREFPGFDLSYELGNDDFLKLLHSGVDVRGAYIATHYQEIIPNAMAFTAQAVEQGVVNKIRAQGLRPTENSSSAQPAVQPHVDTSKLTREQREEIYRRSLAGETWHP